MSSSNYIKNVALVGAGGNSGRAMAEELLKTGKHNVTALTRADSTTSLPSGLTVKNIDYSDPSTIVAALRGIDALVITMAPMAPPDTQTKLIDAAGEAGVRWILPNEWSPDSTHEGLCKDVFLFQKLADTNKYIREKGKSHYVALTTGFWYEWSIAFPGAFGFDFEKKELTLFDDGETKMSVSTWPQVGRAVAALLSLPVTAEGGDAERCLERFKDQNVYISSFTVSQKDMLASVLRVTGAKESDWTTKSEPSKDRYEAGIAKMKEGDRQGFLRMMYTRVFYPDGSGDFESSKGTINELLGLPKEDLDESTKIGIKRAKEPAA